MDGWRKSWSVGRPARGLVGTVVTSAAAAVVVAGLAGCGGVIGLGGKQFTDDRVESATVTAVRLTGADGSVTVRRGSVSGVEIHRQVWYRHDRPQRRADRMEGSTLVLDTDCGRDCSFGYTVTLPSQVGVSGHLGTGPIDVSGMSTVDVSTDDGSVKVHDASGKVKVETGTGPVDVVNAPSVDASTHDGGIRVWNVAGAVVAQTGTGPIDITDVKGDVDATSSDGGIDLTTVGGRATARTRTGPINGTGIGGTRSELRTADGSITLRLSAAQDIEAHTNTGAITLTVPTADQGYRVQTHTDTGPTRIDIATVPTGGHLLNLSTKDGSITVLAA